MNFIMRKQKFCLCENKGAVAAQLISTVVSTTWIVQSLFLISSEYQACSPLLRLHRLVRVRPGWNLWKPLCRSLYSNIKANLRKPNFLHIFLRVSEGTIQKTQETSESNASTYPSVVIMPPLLLPSYHFLKEHTHTHTHTHTLQLSPSPKAEQYH